MTVIDKLRVEQDQDVSRKGLPLVHPQALLESGLTVIQFQHLVTAGIVSVSPNIVSGAIVFTGTRVPIYNLWDYLNGGAAWMIL